MRILERIALVLAGGAAGALLALIADRSGLGIDWAAAGTITAIVSAVAAFVFAAVQLRQQTEAERLSQKPYLRADVAFEEADGRENHLLLPEGAYVYRPAELGILDALATVRAAVGPLADEPAFRLVVWVRNLQEQSLAIADRITVTLQVFWDVPTGDASRDRRNSATVDIELAYLAPGQTTAVELALVRRSIYYLLAEVASVRYGDVLQRATLVDVHGALKMLYTEGAVRNERGIRRSYELRLRRQRRSRSGTRVDR